MRRHQTCKDPTGTFFKSWRCLLLLIPLCGAGSMAFAQNINSVSQDISFNSAGMEIQPVTAANGTTYSVIHFPDCSLLEDQPGHPALPVRYIQLIVPKDRNFSDLTVQAGNPTVINLQAPVFPIQHRIRTSEDTPPPPFAEPDPEAYNMPEPGPQVLVKYIGDGYFDGDKHLVKLAIYPVQYAPQNGQLLVYHSLSFTLTENLAVQPTLHSISRAPITRQSVYDHALENMVMNPGDIPLFSTAGNPGVTPGAAHGTAGKAEFYEYVIITSNKLRPAFEELIGWKRRKGLDAGIVDIQDILSDPDYVGGDLTSNINDDAGKVRAYLAAAYQNGTMYAVLGGDASVIPIRYGHGSYDTFSIPQAIMPSDLYFTDFNGNWNTDGDSYYGERLQDNVDFNPEIFVGRMLVNDELQVTNQVYKIIRYERNPGRGNNGYVATAFMTQADQMMDGNEAGLLAAQMPFYSTINIWNESPPPGSNALNNAPDPTAVIQEMDKHYGFVSLIGHGSPNNIAVATGKYNECPKRRVNSLDVYNGICTTAQPGNAFDNLDDFDHVVSPYISYPNVFYSISCETNPFDLYGKLPGDIDMGEAYTRHHKAGGAAYLGNTREGWVGVSTDMAIEFAKQLVAGNTHIGMAEGLSKSVFYNGWGWCEKTHSLLGCPEMDMWTAKPKPFDNASVSGSGGSITVSTGGVTGATISVISAFDNGATYRQTAINVASATFTGLPSHYSVCITRHNFTPFLRDYNIIVQNQDFYGTAYVGAPNDISSGMSVDKNQVSGPVTIKSGANVFFHADGNGTILLDKGFEVEPQAAFEAK